MLQDFSRLAYGVAADPPSGRTALPNGRRPRGRSREAVPLLRSAARLHAAGRHREAIEPLRLAIRFDPDNAAAHLSLGTALRQCGWAAEAIPSLDHAVSLDPDAGEAHYQLGLALEDTGQRSAAIDSYRRAVLHLPRLTDAHARLGYLLADFGQRSDAARHLRLAADTMPDATPGRLHRAKALMLEEHYTGAEPALREILAVDPDNAEANRLLASVLALQGAFADAATHFQRSIATDPLNCATYLDLVRARKITQEDRPLIERMTALAATRLPDEHRTRLHFALGKALDDTKDYAAAWQHFSAANRLRRASVAADRQEAEAFARRMIATVTPDWLAGYAGDPDETPVLVLGMPRSGTTLVEQILSSHPQVAGGGELRVWTAAGARWRDDSYRSLAAGNIHRLTDEYLNTLRRIGPSALRVTDKNPFNFFWLGLIRAVFPRARIIHCRRDPVDTCLSLHTTHFSGPMPLASDLEDLVVFYHVYRSLMAHWRSLFEGDRFVEVHYETLIADPEAETRRLIAACGLPWNDACLRPEQNTRAVVTASLWQARQPINAGSIERWRRYEPWIGPLLKLREEA
jgi:tetratricopeptide (TPR) repeat protein